MQNSAALASLLRFRNPIVEALLALAITVVSVLILLNGSLLSPYNAWHIDLSINLVASHALADGANPYGPTTLFERAISLGSPTRDVYQVLFTSYIQPPTSALHLLPLTLLPWRDATHLYLWLNHVFLFAAVALALVTVRPAVPWYWAVAGAGVIIAAFACIPFSMSLGQVDPTILLLLAVGFWGYRRDRSAVAGAAIAVAAAIKLIPGLLLLYFLWKREYRIVLWGAAVGLALFLVSFVFVGYDVYRTYFEEALPALTKGSTHYSNTALNAIISRAATPAVVDGVPEMLYVGEVPSGGFERFAFAAIELAGLLAIAFVVGLPRRMLGRSDFLVFEYYFVVAVGLLISSSTWDFYVIWLLPVFFAAYLTPSLLPPPPLRWWALGALTVAFIGLNYPADFYFFEFNDFYFRPDLVPGRWVEDRIGLYHNHLDAVILLRLPSLLLLTATLGALVVWRRRQEHSEEPVVTEAPPEEPEPASSLEEEPAEPAVVPAV
jgi:hypothetical protein